MYKNLSPSALGIFGRQGEMLEIALTHRFKGLEIDIMELVKRAQTTSVPQACRYLLSAQMQIGAFDLPVRWAGDEADFHADLAQLPAVLEVATALNADRCLTTVRPTSDQLPFHENFQFHVDRLGKVADLLAKANVKLGLDFSAAPSDRADGGFQFIYQAEPMLLLLNAIQRDNVGLVVDTWSWFVGGGDTEKVRSLRPEQVISVRLADVPAGVEIANATEEERVMPGEGGAIDSVAVLTVLEELGYDGPVAVAMHPSLTKGQKREAIVAKASSVLDTLFASASISDASDLAGTAK